MINLLRKRSNLYWSIIILTGIITFGFLLANPSIGVDDENLDFYFKYNAMAASGRYGYVILDKLFHSFGYYPFWRDGLTIVVLLIGVTLFANIFDGLWEEKSEIPAIIFASVFLTYPMIGQNFVYIGGNIEISLMIVIAAIGVWFSNVWIRNHKLKFLLLSIGTLIAGLSILENCINYYITGMFISLWIMNKKSIQKNERGGVKTFLCYLKYCMVFVGVSGIAVILNALIKLFVYNCFHLPAWNYSNKYIIWDFEHLFESIKTFVLGFLVQNKGLFQETVYMKILILSLVIIIGVSITDTIKYKQITSCFLGILMELSVFALYFYSGNYKIVTRSLVAYGLFSAFAIAVLFKSIRTEIYKAAICILAFGVVFNQSLEIQKLYKADHERYLYDVNMARMIHEDVLDVCNGLPSVPVVFIGNPLPYIQIPNERDDVNLRSIFSDNNDGSSIRIHPFFHMIGIDYLAPWEGDMTPDKYTNFSNNEYTKRAIEYAKYMPSWPEYGSVMNADNLVIVKLGALQLQQYTEKKDIENIYVKGKTEASATCKIYNAKMSGNFIYISGYAYFDDFSSLGSEIKVLLENGEKQLLLATKQSKNSIPNEHGKYDTDENNMNAFSIWIDSNRYDDIKGNWRLKCLITNGSHYAEIEDCSVKEIVID